MKEGVRIKKALHAEFKHDPRYSFLHHGIGFKDLAAKYNVVFLPDSQETLKPWQLAQKLFIETDETAWLQVEYLIGRRFKDSNKLRKAYFRPWKIIPFEQKVAQRYSRIPDIKLGKAE